MSTPVIRLNSQVALDLMIMAGYRVVVSAIGGDRYSVEVIKRESLTCSDVSLERAILAAYQLVMSNG